MKYKSTKSVAAAVALIALLGAANGANAQERGFFSPDQRKDAGTRDGAAVYGCSGAVARVIDVGNEGLLTTSAVFGSSPGGGEGGQFDKTPILTTKVQLADGACLDAHLSAIVGSKQTYGSIGVSNLALFQVTLTGSNNLPRHMYGHYETPYGQASPAVALEAERDVDMVAANFFQRVGKAPHDVPPGVYRVDVWWAGAPPGAAGGAIGAAFVLKLYLR
jgi:hypothetical protein